MLKKATLGCLLFLITHISNAKELLDNVVAVVNDSVITANELRTQVEQTRKQMTAQKIAVPQEKVLRKQVLQRLIDVDLQMQLAKQNNITVDDAELNQAIERIAASNHISLSLLREELTKQGVSWEEYRKNIRKEMILARLQQQAIGKDINITNEQVEHYLKTATEPTNNTLYTYHLQNIVVPLSENPSSSELKKAHARALALLAKARHGADFSRLAIEQSNGEFSLEGGDLGERHLAELPDLFAKEVGHMSVGEVAGPLKAGNGFQLIKLVAMSGAQQKHVIHLTHVRHILLKPDVSMLPSESLQQANNLYEQLKSGKDFAVMAKQYSLDSASAVKGGDLGWVTPGELVPEFEKVMNELAINVVSKPVKTQFGWHLIQVIARKQKEDSAAFKKQQARLFLQQRKFTEAVQDWQQHIRSQAYIQILDEQLV